MPYESVYCIIREVPLHYHDGERKRNQDNPQRRIYAPDSVRVPFRKTLAPPLLAEIETECRQKEEEGVAYGAAGSDIRYGVVLIQMRIYDKKDC